MLLNWSGTPSSAPTGGTTCCAASPVDCRIAPRTTSCGREPAAALFNGSFDRRCRRCGRCRGRRRTGCRSPPTTSTAPFRCRTWLLGDLRWRRHAGFVPGDRSLLVPTRPRAQPNGGSEHAAGHHGRPAVWLITAMARCRARLTKRGSRWYVSWAGASIRVADRARGEVGDFAVADFDGDGRADILHTTGWNCSIPRRIPRRSSNTRLAPACASPIFGLATSTRTAERTVLADSGATDGPLQPEARLARGGRRPAAAPPAWSWRLRR